jgi:hypothetical protein
MKVDNNYLVTFPRGAETTVKLISFDESDYLFEYLEGEFRRPIPTDSNVFGKNSRKFYFPTSLVEYLDFVKIDD